MLKKTKQARLINNVTKPLREKVYIRHSMLDASSTSSHFFDNTRHWFLLVSHKVLRWFAPFFMIACFVASLARWQSPFYKTAFLLQLVFYGIALVGWKWRPRNKFGKLLSLAFYFCMVNLASLVGCVKCFRGDLSGKWVPPRQKVQNQE